METESETNTTQYKPRNPHHECILLSSPSGVGKTSACQRFIHLTKQANFNVQGVLSIPVFEHHQKIAIRLRDLSTNEERFLAYLAQHDENPNVGPWRFIPKTVAWGNTILKQITSSDVLLIDEIGPLELLQGEGLTEILPAIRASKAKLSILTIRPMLIDALVDQLKEIPCRTLQLTKENREQIPHLLLNFLSEENIQ